MSRKPFSFKQFSLNQDRTAMKIGTDGVLLGAWADHENPKSILDIGTGTGLIALMLAQRFPEAFVHAIEIEKNAFEQAKENAENSIFRNRISVERTMLQRYKPEMKFDLIVSNPPFFPVNNQNERNPRNIARQENTLDFSSLIRKSSELLKPEGAFSVIIPFDRKDEFMEISRNAGLYPSEIINVKGSATTEFKRTLLKFKGVKEFYEEKSLIVETSRHKYTDEYIELTKDFYLKM